MEVIALKIVICDDDSKCINDILEHLNYFSIKNGIDFEQFVFSSSEDVINSNNNFDIAILDVEMKEINGIKLGDYLRQTNPHIILIFITAHKKYLDDALNLNAVRFFEKPIDSQRFYRGLKDSIERIDKSSVQFYLKDKKTIERINAQDIIFIEIENRRTRITTIKKVYHSSHHINFWKDTLNSSIFVSPHKSYIVNLNYITKYERDTITLNRTYKISIARNKQTSFYKCFMRFLEGK